MLQKAGRDFLIWVTFFAICLGLGYPTLHRYDPRSTGGTGDSAEYALLVAGGPQFPGNHMDYRLLVPYLARPFYWMAKGRFGTWDPVLFGLLIANALLTAGTAFLLVLAARKVDARVALLAGAVFLLTFDVANAKLAGLVDSGEGFFLMAVVWSLLSGRYRLLPLWGILGALSKESFVPFSSVLVLAWCATDWRRGELKRGQIAGSLTMVLSGLGAITALHWGWGDRAVWPWQFAASLNSHSNYFTNLAKSFADRQLFYEFAWLLPLGMFRLRHLPGSWLVACAAAVAVAFFLNAYYGGQPGTVGRAVHSIAGPLLSLSVAILLAGSATSHPAKTLPD